MNHNQKYHQKSISSEINQRYRCDQQADRDSQTHRGKKHKINFSRSDRDSHWTRNEDGLSSPDRTRSISRSRGSGSSRKRERSESSDSSIDRVFSKRRERYVNRDRSMTNSKGSSKKRERYGSRDRSMKISKGSSSKRDRHCQSDSRDHGNDRVSSRKRVRYVGRDRSMTISKSSSRKRDRSECRDRGIPTEKSPEKKTEDENAEKAKVLNFTLILYFETAMTSNSLK